MFHRFPAFLLGLALSLAGLDASAHHNTGAAFDLEKEITLDGVVTRYQYRNPHIYIFIRTEGGEEWRIEAGPTAIMNRLGWSAGTLKTGDRISMVGNPSRIPNKLSAFLKSASVDGRPLPPNRGEEAFRRLSDDSVDPDESAGSLNGVWVTLLAESSAWIDEPDSLSLTDAGREAIDSFDEKTMSPALDCTPMTAPATMLIPDTKTIEIADGEVRIGSEFNGAYRTIHLAGRPPGAPTTQGHSTGVLADNVLEVDTSGFEVHSMGIANRLPSSSGKRLHEEFVLDEDGKGLTYSFVLTDPEYLMEPVKGQVHWAYQPDAEFAALPCDLENSRLFLDE